MRDRRLRRRSGGSIFGECMTKTFTLPALRVKPELGQRIKADQETSGDRSMAQAIRRLIERGLGNPFLKQTEHETLKGLVYQLNKLGVNLNQLAERMNAHGHLREYEIEDLAALARDIGKVSQQARTLMAKSR